MLGVALGERRREVVIASKFGLHVGEEQTVFDGAAVTRAIDESLEALGTDYLDLMQIHWPGNIGYIGQDRACWSDAAEVAAALEGAVSAGKLRYYGCCNFGTDDLVAFEQGPRTSHHKLHEKYCVVTFVETACSNVRTHTVYISWRKASLEPAAVQSAVPHHRVRHPPCLHRE
jgi:aryl-alcohol dehydrogenase-like predicted oxidoreductase